MDERGTPVARDGLAQASSRCCRFLRRRGTPLLRVDALDERPLHVPNPSGRSSAGGLGRVAEWFKAAVLKFALGHPAPCQQIPSLHEKRGFPAPFAFQFRSSSHLVPTIWVANRVAGAPPVVGADFFGQAETLALERR